MGAMGVRGFRNDFVNPYKTAPIDLSEYERTKQENLPVWDRVFDHKKYMEHEGPLKVKFKINKNSYQLELLIWMLSPSPE